MAGSDVGNVNTNRGVSWVSSPAFGTVALDFLIRGSAHPCPYRPGLEACEQVFMADKFPPELYHDFMDIGFRRSGIYFYRPECRSCSACRPIRTVLPKFRFGKSLRRILKKNSDVIVSVGSPKFTVDKYRLYSYYLESRHNSTSSDSPSGVKNSLYSSPVQTLEFEYRLGGRLIGAGLVDICSRSLSSVYAYYDPNLSSRSLGTFSALHEIMFALKYRISYYYLGFWVSDCSSMNYKAHYKPFEILSQSFQWEGQAD
ncbi:MAG: arginyltransferase [Desulfomonile tiedjei]|uniref:Aspartate/glutamate leucyltransferase n=1 Tax=Desulfomonile tiedjei TaxID=2358 RepID=A0A9D6V450_9BACT|nr:arginyltransferase [Desulfomonile tiedjei]